MVSRVWSIINNIPNVAADISCILFVQQVSHYFTITTYSIVLEIFIFSNSLSVIIYSRPNHNSVYTWKMFHCYP